MARRKGPASATRLALTAAAIVLICASAASAAGAALEKEIARVLADKRLAGARVGIHVRAVPSGRIIFSRNGADRFIVASNQKLVTAATALCELGEGYEFRTRLYITGTQRQGKLVGDVILRGGGDPTIGGRYDETDALELFARWARRLKRRGIRTVTGSVVADDSFFDRQHVRPDWPESQLWKWYCAPVSALSVNDNCVQLACMPGPKPGLPARVQVVPDVGAIVVKNRCKTSSKRHTIWFNRGQNWDMVIVGGFVRRKSGGYTGWVSVPEPALFAAKLFKHALAKEGISVAGAARLIKPDERTAKANRVLVAEHRTALVPVIRSMLKESYNHYAEQVIKTVGAETTGLGSWSSGLKTAARLLRSLNAGPGTLELSDGGGMSRKNILTPAVITALLAEAGRRPWGKTFTDALPVAGVDGTLASRMKEEPYRGSVRAKTGYLRGVGALSGCAETRSGARVAFSILINDFAHSGGNRAMKQIEDRICRAIVDCAP